MEPQQTPSPLSQRQPHLFNDRRWRRPPPLRFSQRTAREPTQQFPASRRGGRWVGHCPSLTGQAPTPTAADLTSLPPASSTHCFPDPSATVDDGDEVRHIGPCANRIQTVRGGPDMETDRIGRHLADCGVYSGRPDARIGEFDRARQHYVGFTRVRHLLVLTASGDLQAKFSSICRGAARWPAVDRNPLARQRFGVAWRRAAADGRN